jgi:signal transduction histidine kinase
MWLATIARQPDHWEDRRVARLVVMALALAYGVASVAVALDVAPNAATTYAAASPAAAAAGLAAGFALIGAGCVAWWERPHAAIGPVTLALGVVWLAPNWVGWEAGPALVRTVAMVAAPLALPLLVVLVAPRAARFALAVGAAFSLAAVLFGDPFLDPYCWSNCTDDAFLVHADPDLAGALEDAGRWLVISGGVALALYAGRRLVVASPAARAATWSVLVPAAFAALGEAAYAVALAPDGAEDPGDAAFAVIFLVRAFTYAALAAGVAWTVVRGRATRAAVKRLADDLGAAPEPGSLRAALARSLGDPGVAVAYPIPGSGAHVDAEGRPVAIPANGRATTPIVRNGQPVAVVIHDGALAGAETLEREIGAAARLAVDNERLRAEALAQLEDLRASRARVIEAGDTARRRIERDLHDGAQQRLLTLSYELRLALADARAGGDDELADLLAAGAAEVQTALAELRELAHGIHPVVLSEGGLGPALWTLADSAAVPVEIAAVPDERLPAAVERAAYAVVSWAVGAAGDHLAVRVCRDAQVEVTAGPVTADVPVHVADRVGALGGRIRVEDGTLRAELPCA